MEKIVATNFFNGSSESKLTKPEILNAKLLKERGREIIKVNDKQTKKRNCCKTIIPFLIHKVL